MAAESSTPLNQNFVLNLHLHCLSLGSIWNAQKGMLKKALVLILELVNFTMVEYGGFSAPQVHENQVPSTCIICCALWI